MAGFVERVVIEVQARTKGAAADLKSMGSDVKEASGLFGKAKAGLSGMGDTMKGLIGGPTGYVALGTAAVAGAIKLADGFTTAALAADNMANRTGMASEAASRWIAVADDVGISADTITSAAQKLVQNIGAAPAKFEAMGISAANSNDAMRQAIELLGKTPEGADRAALGIQLFGKQWGSVSELATMSAKQLEAALADVGDAQVFSASEIAKAKDYREAMDRFNDSMADLANEVGADLAPALADAATSLAQVLEGVQAIVRIIPGMDRGLASAAQSIIPFSGLAEGFKRATNESGGFFDRLTGGLESFTSGIPGLNIATNALADWTNQGDDAAKTADVVNQSVFGLSGAQDELVASTQAVDQEQQQLTESLDATAKAMGLLNDAANDALGLDVKLADANDGLAQSIADRAKAGKQASDIEDDASRKVLKNAQDVGKAQQDAAKQQAQMRGETLSTAQANAVLAASYEATAAKLAPNDPLRARLTAYATELRNVPDTAHTDVTANTTQAQQQLEALQRELQRTREQAQLLAAITSGNTNFRSWIVGQSAGTTSVTVNVPPTLNPAKVLAAVGAGQSRNGGLRRG